MSQTGNRLWQEVQDKGAVWRHHGDVRAPHVVLRSGLHSDVFIDTLQYLTSTQSLVQAAMHVAKALRWRINPSEIDWIFGSPMAGIPLATLVAKHLEIPHVGFTEKTTDNKTLVCRFNVAPGSKVLLIEEMTTTGETPQRGIEAILRKNPEVFITKVVGSFISRCGTYSDKLPKREIVSVIDLLELGWKFGEWIPDECPLCKAGSPAITNPKKVWKDLLETMRDPCYKIS